MSFDRSFFLLRVLKLFDFAIKIIQQALKHDQAGTLGLAGLSEAYRLDRRLEAIVLAGRDQVIELRAGETRYWTRAALWKPDKLRLGRG